MELRHLRYFVAVAEELHFGRAAQRLHMSQPPLSQQIQRFERELGVRLFDRTKRRVKLSDAGLAFLPEARKALAQVEEALESARRAARGQIGLLRIAFVSTAAHSVLPIVLRAYLKRFPEVELSLQELASGLQVASLEAGTIDVGFIRPPVEGPNLHLEVIWSEPLVAAVPKTHRLAAQDSLRVEELAEEPFILVPRRLAPGLYDRIVTACHQEGFTPRVVQEAVQMGTIAGLVAGGLGVAVVPAAVKSLRLEGVTFCRLIGRGGSPLESELALARRGDDSRVVLEAFFQIVRETVMK